MASQRDSMPSGDDQLLRPIVPAGNQREDLQGLLQGLLLTILAGVFIAGISAAFWLSVGSLSRLS